jgi:exopolyphosphatase/guanosine-5'-triphosphate,3'-diphosphate pyrophosphatase
LRVAIVDIGSNTARLLVAARTGASLQSLREERELLALGEEVEQRGYISELKLAETAACVRRYAHIARLLGCATVEVIVTAPGRQSRNAQELVRALETAAGSSVRVLSPQEEGGLAYAGALADARVRRGRVAVCDVGGGSTEVVAGRVAGGPSFCHSLDIGSLRLTRRFLEEDPPGKKAVAAARAEIAEHLGALDPPRVREALATGGSARSLRKLVGGRTLGEEQLALAVKRATKRPSRALAGELGLDQVRARTLLAGALILSAVQQRLGVPFEVARAGLREGAALALLAEEAAA